MSVSAQIEIAASPEDVRRIFLDFPSWHKIGDGLLRSVTLVPSTDPKIVPGEKGSYVTCNFGGLANVQLLVAENSPEAFSWYGNILNAFSGVHSFKLLPSEVTKGYTTFVNQEVFGKGFWLLYKIGVMRPQADFDGLVVNVKKRVEVVLEEEKE